MPIAGFADQVLRTMSKEDAGLPSHLVREVRSILFSEYVQKTLLPTLETFQPDVIYERYSLFAYAGVELSRQLQVPLLLEVNSPLCMEQAKHRQLVLRRTAEELECKVINSADALIVVSETLADYARRLGVSSERITVLPNGVDPQRFHPTVSGNDVRSLYNLNGKKVIGFVGSLKPWHDLDTLLDAVEFLAKTDEAVHLLVVGQGSRMDQLRSLGNGHMTCTGAVEHPAVPRFLAAMDVVVVPYSNEGESYFSPLKLFEAMAMAKPIVGARVGQVAEVLTHGETGLIYEPGNADDLSARIGEVLDMPDRGAALGMAARRQAEATQTWDHNAHRITAVAQSLLQRRRSS